MNTSDYTSDELKLLYGVLDAAMSGATGDDLEIPVQTMTERLFAAAAKGERDPERLKAAIFEISEKDD